MSTEISIKQLSQITELNSDDLLLVQTPNATNSLLFSNFVVGLDNTTFGSTITKNVTDIVSLSANVAGLIGADSGVGSVLSKVQSVSSQVLGVSSIGTSTFNELSASSLSANGVEFKGYPAHAQTIFNKLMYRVGNNDVAVDLDLEANMNLTFPDSQVRVIFNIPASNGTADNHGYGFVVQESLNGTAWNDVPTLLGPVSGTALKATVFGGTDADAEGGTTSFTGYFTPTSLGTNNVIYVRIMMRVESTQAIHQNGSGGSPFSPSTNDTTGVSNLIIEEVFT
jgi:hypothetical protein